MAQITEALQELGELRNKTALEAMMESEKEPDGNLDEHVNRYIQHLLIACVLEKELSRKKDGGGQEGGDESALGSDAKIILGDANNDGSLELKKGDLGGGVEPILNELDDEDSDNTNATFRSLLLEALGSKYE
jgi:hypothetical protein